MVRVGKWDEQKVLFKNIADGGHGHTGGVAGSRLGDGAINSSLMIATAQINAVHLGTGALKYFTNIATIKKFWYGSVTKSVQDGTYEAIWMNGATGFSYIDFVIMYSTSTLAAGAGTVVAGNRTDGRADTTDCKVWLPTCLGIGAAAPDGVYMKVWGH